MKNYADCLESIYVDTEMHDRTMKRLRRFSIPKRSNRMRLRPIIIFAALLAFTSMSAFATVQINKTLVRQTDYGTAYVSPVETLPISETLRQYLADDANAPMRYWPDGTPVDGCELYIVRFLSLSEASAFFEIDIAKNHVLAQSTQGIRAMIFYNMDESGVVYLFANSYRTSYQIHFSFGNPGEIKEHSLGTETDNVEEYASPKSGIQAQIGSETTVFIRNNLVYMISGVRGDTDSEQLKKIIDMYYE